MSKEVSPFFVTIRNTEGYWLSLSINAMPFSDRRTLSSWAWERGFKTVDAFSSLELPGPLSCWRLGTRTKWLWGHRITEVLDSRTSGIHVLSREMSLNSVRITTWRLSEAISL